MQTVIKEVTVVGNENNEWESRKEKQEFIILHEDREDFFCKICKWPYYPECLQTCSVGVFRK